MTLYDITNIPFPNDIHMRSLFLVGDGLGVRYAFGIKLRLSRFGLGWFENAIAYSLSAGLSMRSPFCASLRVRALLSEG
ncbi:hypothetical protein [Brunnivagina elsteri]|uniref:Uncharacterized protein n=1 Tax=Brunnivagina elsteri CCALA 953 TaxID=987040 RepID=A0A2A2TMP9_9CYAN|nr:hypothetical protein [Calothrix elsteri]PAX59826.1 hypothetical protein CK510_05060 [Calothrix elsteri CCALA 953]